MNQIKKKDWVFFFLIIALQSMAANFAHPITPTIIKGLNLPDYCFGLFFAGMAFTNFLFSPMWAKQVKRMGSRKVLGICCVGYAMGQGLFSIFKSVPTILFARLFSGFFVGGIMVSYLTYIIHKASIEDRGKYLALSATFATVFGAFGYLIGGVVGVYSISITFAIQVIALASCGFLFYFTLQEDKEEAVTFNFMKDANPLKAFIDSKQFMTKLFALLFFIVFITSVATTAFDQCFNYYIKDQFAFDSSYNGMLKAVVGFISLLANTTICMWILKYTDVKKSVVYVLGCCGLSLLAIVFIEEVIIFVIVVLIFFAFNAIYIPLLQDLCAQSSNEKNSHMVMGFYNAMKSLGMIIGALFAGFIYAYGSKLTFIFASLFFFIAMLLCIVYNKKHVTNS